MLGRLNHRHGHYALLLAAGALLFLVNLGGPSLWDVDEGRNAGCAYEMLESGNYLVPTFNAELRVDKPPLLYWLQTVAFRWLGLGELAARLPSALAALLTVLLVYELGRALFDRATALLAGLIFASTPMVCGSARFANPDALLNLFTVLSLLMCWRGYARLGRLLFLPLGLATGVAVLAKGPVGVVMPAAVMLAFLAWAGKLRLFLMRRLVLGIVAFLVVTLPWYVFVGVETKGEFLRGFFLDHNLNRFRDAMENHSGGPFYYLLVLFVGFAPWSAFFGLTAWYSFRGEKGTDDETTKEGAEEPAHATSSTSSSALSYPRFPVAAHDAYRFLGCWAGVYLLFFTVSATKLPNYILPLCAPLALLTARWLERWRRGEVQPRAWALTAGLACFALVGVATGVGLAAAGAAGTTWLPRSQHFAGLEWWAILGLFPVLGAAAALWFLRRGQRAGFVVCVLAAAFLLIGPLAAWAIAALDGYKAPRPLVQEAGALQRKADIRVGCYDLRHLPSMTFYCQRTVLHLEREEDALDFLRWHIPIFLFLPEQAWQRLQERGVGPCRVVSRRRDLYHNCTVIGVTNR
jgi:4-amino-4-deoxy-L-arabinose transferase-like glycosyltransferase